MHIHNIRQKVACSYAYKDEQEMTVKANRLEYGEQKERISVNLTPTAQRLLNEQGESLGISRSELIERFARGLLSAEVRSLGEFCAN